MNPTKVTTSDDKRLFTPKERLEHFNKCYELNISFKDQIIDLTNCKRYSDTHGPIYLNKDLSRMFFDYCIELYLPAMSVKICELRPKMRRLKRLFLHSSRIRVLTLDPTYFQTLEVLSLDNNRIKTYDDIKNFISKLPKLKKIILSNNPISTDDKYLPEINKIKKLYKHLNIVLNSS